MFSTRIQKLGLVYEGIEGIDPLLGKLPPSSPPQIQQCIGLTPASLLNGSALVALGRMLCCARDWTRFCHGQGKHLLTCCIISLTLEKPQLRVCVWFHISQVLGLKWGWDCLLYKNGTRAAVRKRTPSYLLFSFLHLVSLWYLKSILKLGSPWAVGRFRSNCEIKKTLCCLSDITDNITAYNE